MLVITAGTDADNHSLLRRRSSSLLEHTLEIAFFVTTGSDHPVFCI